MWISMSKLYEAIWGAKEWHKICRHAKESRNEKQAVCYYIIPETESDPVIERAAAEHMAAMSQKYQIYILRTENAAGNYDTDYEEIILSEKRMNRLLTYFRTQRDTLLMMNIPNVYIVSFKEAGGRELERLYQEQIYDSGFLVRRWLLPDNMNPGKRRGN